MSTILRAVQYAAEKHSKDTRKFSGEPYIYHCLRVMNEVMLHPKVSEEKYVLAAVCHDIIEDHPEPTPEEAYADLSAVIGVEATIVVGELTNRYEPAQYRSMNRAERKRAEFRRLSACSDEVKVIKMLDRIDNLRSFDLGEVLRMEPKERKKAYKFGELYGIESVTLFGAIGSACRETAMVGKSLATWLAG